MTGGQRGGQVPRGWGDDELSSFLESAAHNALAIFQQIPTEYALLRDVDAAFERLLGNLDNPPDQLAPLFLYRAHAAYRAAAQLALGGQAPESYPLSRMALEYAFLASYLNRHRDKFDSWKRRSESEVDKKRVRNEFATGTLLTDLEARDRVIHRSAEPLYGECIDMGSHPTDMGIFANIATVETPEAVHVDTQYLMGDSPQFRYALRTCARAGLVVLGIARLIFRERFDLLGLSGEIDRLSALAVKGAA